ncbi:MAG: AAA family ATPase [Christensenellaceae bacterium]|jgi:ATP-dependent Clp protease ATP-binding subunit ClpX|nr:AAA family ATPase [Christensenellaceae bacterium]
MIKETLKAGEKPLPTPAEIVAKLDEYVIGQDSAKKILAVATYNQYKRVRFNLAEGGLEIKKSNVLMIGPTGSGKTYISQTLAKIFDIPFASISATELLSGENKIAPFIERALTNLVNDANGNIDLAEQGIVFIDEIDKVAKRGANIGVGESVQQQLLKVIEGFQFKLPDFEREIDTTNILFVFGGVFVGLDGIVYNRTGAALSLDDLFSKIETEDIVKFGMIPEFVGRVPTIITLKGLDTRALIKVLTKSKGSLVLQYKKMLEADGVELEFADDALIAIAEKAYALNTGARSLQGIMERIMREVMFKAPTEKGLVKVIITKAAVLEREEPIYEYDTIENDAPLTPIPPLPVHYLV